MKCYNHTDVDTVSTCQSCGVGLCKECVDSTVYTKEEKALCYNCNVVVAKENVVMRKKIMNVETFKLVLFSILFFVGLAGFIQMVIVNPADVLSAYFIAACIWGFAAIGTIYQNVKVANANMSVKQAVAEAKHEGSTFIGKSIGYIIAYIIHGLLMPIKYVMTVINYIKFKKEYKLHLALASELQS